MEFHMIILSAIFLSTGLGLFLYSIVMFSMFDKKCSNDNLKRNGKFFTLYALGYMFFAWIFLIVGINDAKVMEHLAVFKGTSNYEVVVKKNVDHDIKYKDGVPVDTLESVTYDTVVVIK